MAKRQVAIARANSSSVIGDDPMNPRVVIGVKPQFHTSSEAFIANFEFCSRTCVQEKVPAAFGERINHHRSVFRQRACEPQTTDGVSVAQTGTSVDNDPDSRVGSRNLGFRRYTHGFPPPTSARI